jgi:arginyl-tRNA synthetase
MIDKAQWKALVQARLQNMYESTGHEGKLADVVIQVPPKPELGDLAFPLFAFAKAFSKAPNILSQQLADDINALSDKPDGEAFSAGPYMNVRLNMDKMVSNLYRQIVKQASDYGKTNAVEGKKVMIEFSCPNTNKPLHLGHVRNDCIGQSMSQILKACGADVMKVNLINNRGVHICKSMLAYKKFGNGETPESSGIKGDHLVGNYYVRFAQWEKEVLDKDIADLVAKGMDKEKAEEIAKANNAPDLEAQAMLRDWENGVPEVIDLWKKMNQWTLDGVAETYANTGISFDKYYYESDTYKLGKDKVLEGLEKGVFQKSDDGAIFIDNSDIGLDKKILLRKDGTSIYITQDIGTAISRHADWAFNELVYVVATEQNFHFKVLFYILKKLGFDWSNKLYHLAYGLVNLPNGRMKSREGTVVDADDLIDSLHADALKAIKEKGREEEVGNADEVAEKVALAALHYYLLQVSPIKDMVFNPEESLSFNGNTGPYLQYMGARIASILRKASDEGTSPASPENAAKLLKAEEEWDLVKRLGEYPETVARAATAKDSSVMANYIYDIVKLFSKFYQQCPIMSAETKELKEARLALAKATLRVLKEAMGLVLVPYLERM